MMRINVNFRLTGRRQPGAVLALLVLLLCPVLGQNYAEPYPPTNPDSALSIILTQIKGEPLHLADAREKALQNATDLRAIEAALQAALAIVRRERGVFDPELFVSFLHSDDRQPTASFFSGAPVLQIQERTTRGGVRWQLPTGTFVEASLNAVRLKTNSSFAFLNPQYTAFGNLTIRQPLLSGFWRSGRKNLSRAEQDLAAAQARYNQALQDITARVERLYWDLYAAERDFAVQLLIRDRAQALLEETRVRARAGLVGPNQEANARVFLADQELAVLDREEQLDRVSDAFAALIGVRPAQGLPRYRALDKPPGDFDLPPLEQLLEAAFDNNFELQAALRDIAAQELLARAAGWEALPSLDVIGSIGGNGLSGAARNVIFGGDTLRTDRGGNLGDAVGEALSRDFPNWSVGVELSIPIGLRSGRAERDRLKAQVVQSRQRYIAVRRSLEEQIRTSYRELGHGLRRLEIARSGVAAAQEQVRIGQIEYRNGRSTAFELVRLAADLAIAQQRYSQALVRSAKAAATLRQLTAGAYPYGTGS